ncbi:hypothetical protein SteCoe_13332 [Stentor coeruleus]|uniref:Cyclic nucleotide-binding domain-containing protein n=1 Tax=Stentor coeruleus TaxID=5963 RepID=A0A1R2C8N0_9CILI|nr:hypothetical protein SteCoe_13332 [Stentor coeruleus]
MIDVFVNCISAYYISEDHVEVSNKAIFLRYLKSWMIIDLSASIPFQLISSSGHWKSLLRFGRFKRLWNLAKIAKIFRILNSEKSLGCLEKLNFCFKVPLGLKRLGSFISFFAIVCHLIACLWHFAATVQDYKYNNWVTKYGIENLSHIEIYMASLYWTITTLATVGYGDITPSNSLERGICIAVMLGGVFFYSYTVGTMTSLMASMQRRNAKLENKILVLKEINQKYRIGKKFFKEINSALNYDKSQFNKEKDDLVAMLPRKLALQLNVYMNKKIVEKSNFFDNRPTWFINLVLKVLKPMRVRTKENVFYKNEYAMEMYFVAVGEMCLYDIVGGVDVSFYSAQEGDYFGDIGMILSEPHEYSVKSITESEMLILTRNDFILNILCAADDKLKADLIEKTNQRKEMFREKRDCNVEKYIENKNLVNSVTEENKQEFGEVLLSIPSDKSAQQLYKIRETLSPKTKTMLDFTGVNDFNMVNREFQMLKSAVKKFQDRVNMDQKISIGGLRRGKTLRIMSDNNKGSLLRLATSSMDKKHHAYNDDFFDSACNQNSTVVSNKQNSTIKIFLENSRGDKRDL